MIIQIESAIREEPILNLNEECLLDYLKNPGIEDLSVFFDKEREISRESDISPLVLMLVQSV